MHPPNVYKLQRYACSNWQYRKSIFRALGMRIITPLPAPLLLLVISASSTVLCLPLGAPFLNSRCVPFRSGTCNILGFSGYDHTPFPHPLSSAYVYSIDVLERVANEIIDRTVSSGCSPLAAKFLCFTYFPFCSPDKPGIRPVVPCKSLCERVREDCSSENRVAWLPWDCDLIGNYSVGSLCVDINDTSITSKTITAASAPNGNKSECANCSGIGLLSPNSTFWSQTCATGTYKDDHIYCALLYISSTVFIRILLFFSRFVFFLNVCFFLLASKVSVASRLASNGTVTYNVTVDVVYVPKTCADNSQGLSFVTLLSVTPSATPSCTCPGMEVGASYLVSDYQVLGSSSSNTVPTWSLTAEGTVALWSDSYDELLTASGKDTSCS